MPTVWIIPEGSDSAPSAAAGDYLLRPRGGDYEVGRQDSACTWIGTLGAGLLPELPTVQEPQEAPEQQRVLAAAQGLESAEANRGG